MPDNNQAAPIELAAGYNPFSDEITPQAEVSPAPEPVVNNEPAAEPQVQVDNNPQPEPQAQPSFDPNQFVKERFGFDNVEQAEQEFKRVKEFKEPEFNFSDDTSKNLFNAIKEGKSDEVFNILNQQKNLDRLTTAELNPSLAVDIIKTNIQNKYKDLAPDEVDLLFYENYNFPAKPEQGYDEADEDYTQKLKNWQSQVDFIEKRMVIDAKVIRPELSKLKSDLKLPDIYNEEKLAADYAQENEAMQQARSGYEKALDSEFNSFNGFNVSVKDEEVDIPITFNVAEDERLAIKQDLSDFDSDAYFGGRWFNEEGKPKVQQMMADKYVLENFNKILQKVANEAASQRLLAHLKKSGNIQINQPTPQGTPQQSFNSQLDELAKAVWS